MGKYLIQANYSTEGLKGLAKEGGSARRASLDALVKKHGGKVEAFYYAFGDVDVYSVLELPDNVVASALALAINRSGAVNVKTTVLLTPEEVDQVVKKEVEYRAPGH